MLNIAATLLAGLTLTGASPFVKRSFSYSNKDTYNAGNWMSEFTVDAMSDPTGGFVTYVDQGTAQADGLYKIEGNQVYMGVDHTTTLNPSGAGRNSVRLTSNKAYATQALVIADFAHLPASACGSWPAFWMLGEGSWPGHGEIDIIEGVNQNTYNTMTLHTSEGCDVSVGSRGQTGQSGATDCGAGGGYNGCGVTDNAVPFGNSFPGGGGTYVTLWDSSEISIWYFADGNVPGDITSGNPNPDNWGTPAANFGGCAFDQYFTNLQLTFDLDFCGSWAGQTSVWDATSCAAQQPSCNAYVAENPGAFSDVNFLVNSIDVYY